MNDQDLRELVNPVFNTAKSCVQLDAATGNEDAQRLIDVLGFESFGAKIGNAPIPDEMREKVMKLVPAYTIIIETRLQSMNRMIDRKEDHAVVDLPCGYSSRGIRLSRLGRTYYGCDLPAVADAMGPAMEAAIGKMGFELHEVCMADHLPEKIASIAGNAEADLLSISMQ